MARTPFTRHGHDLMSDSEMVRARKRMARRVVERRISVGLMTAAAVAPVLVLVTLLVQGLGR